MALTPFQSRSCNVHYKNLALKPLCTCSLQISISSSKCIGRSPQGRTSPAGLLADCGVNHSVARQHGYDFGGIKGIRKLPSFSVIRPFDEQPKLLGLGCYVSREFLKQNKNMKGLMSFSSASSHKKSGHKEKEGRKVTLQGPPSLVHLSIQRIKDSNPCTSFKGCESQKKAQN